MCYLSACAILCVASMNPAITCVLLSWMSCCIHSMATSSSSPKRSFSCAPQEEVVEHPASHLLAPDLAASMNEQIFWH